MFTNIEVDASTFKERCEIAMVDHTPLKELPLIINDLETEEAKERLQERLTNG